MQINNIWAVATVIALSDLSLAQKMGDELLETEFDTEYREHWDEAYETPNVTGSVNFTGYDLSKPYSLDAKRDAPWRADVLMRVDVPQVFHPNESDFDDYYQRDPEDTLALGFSLRLVSEDSSGKDEADGSWRTCATFLALNGSSTEGGCKGLVSDECLEFLKGFGERGGGCKYGVGYTEDYKAVEFGESVTNPCTGEITLPSGMVEWHRPDSEEEWWIEWRLASLPYADTVEDRGAGGAYYKDWVNTTFMAFVTWGPEEEWMGLESFDRDAKLCEGAMFCVRPDEMAEGSFVPEGFVEKEEDVDEKEKDDESDETDDGEANEQDDGQDEDENDGENEGAAQEDAAVTLGSDTVWKWAVGVFACAAAVLSVV